MAKQIIQVNRYQGISYSEKEGPRSSYLFGRSVDYRTDPTKLTILPRTVKESGSVVTDLPKWADRQGDDVYVYGDTGNIYKRDSSNSWSLEHTAADSNGNGLKYFGEDSWLYYSQDTTIGRHGPFWGTTNYTDDFLGAEGGVPTNTASLDLEASSEHYATAADSASLSITGDISMEIYVKHESLPSVDETMMYISKWDENSNERSYYFGVSAASGFFGDGGDGSLTISSNTTQSPTDSACSGTAASTSLSATNASFATGQKILIHQTRGTGAGSWERNEIASYTAGTITTVDPLQNTYSSTGASKAQVIVLAEYTNVTVDSGKTWTAKAWNGTVGGILCFLASGTITVTGTITADGGDGSVTGTGGSGGGYRGGDANTGGGNITANCGEGTDGASAQQTGANGNGGGGAKMTGGGNAAAGGGGGHATSGTAGTSSDPGVTNGSGGGSSGTTDLTTMTFGGGGGGCVTHQATGGGGGGGGGIVFISGVEITVSGTITADGGKGGTGGEENDGGAGAGGSVLLKAQTATLGSSLIGANAGSKTGEGGSGSAGRIHLDYYTSYTGTTSPTLDVTQDDNLVTNTTYRLVLGISSNGTNEETLIQNLDSLSTDVWIRFQVTWDASESTATFYQGGTSLGTSVGSLTSINDSTALLALGASFDSSGDDENWFDGKIDDVRIFDDLRSASELVTNNNIEIGQVANLQAYYQVDSTTGDSSANSNTLTLVNSPAYDTSDVPFASPTTRLDIDQSNSDSGQTYDLTTAIDEGATHRETFTPEKDPQKSIQVNISAIGDNADWTLTVHDAQNREVATVTVDNADLNTGDYEFVFDEPWTPVLGLTYHFHLTVTDTTGTPAVVTGTSSDLEDADFVTYYQFLIENDYHPIEQILNILVIGNGRYLATWNGITYKPHRLTLPSGFNIRALGIWREYLVMGVVRGDSITDYDQGYLFFWDGKTDTYSFYTPVLEGGVNAILSGDPLYFIAGYSGDLMMYQGGKPLKIVRTPKMTNKTTMEVLPQGMTMWRSLVHFAVAGDSDSSTLEKGVYSWGSIDSRIPESLSFDYPTSLGITTGTGMDISMVFPVGSELLIGWKNDTNYGVDVVSPDNDPFPTARCEFLINDADKIWHDKMALTVRGYFKALSSGDSMQLEYKIDRNDSWTEDDAVTTTDAIESRLVFASKSQRFNELQVAIDMATTNSTSPEFYGFGVEIDSLGEERRV